MRELLGHVGLQLVTMPVNSAPVMVAMWLVYWTIDWYSVPRSSLSRATIFDLDWGFWCHVLALPTVAPVHTINPRPQRRWNRIP